MGSASAHCGFSATTEGGEREGAHCFNPATGCATTFIDPIAEYDRNVGQSVTGGYVYRGTNIPALDGTYLYVDFYEARLRGWRDKAGVESVDLGVDTPLSPTTFGQDLNGEIYVFGRGGEVARLNRELS